MGSPAGSQSWVLTIDPVRLADSGQYECQVNTEPKINLAYSLRIVRKCFDFFYANNLIKILCMFSLSKGPKYIISKEHS